MAKSPDREARLAKALRENLRRRKTHGRRAEPGEPRGEDERYARRQTRPNPAGKTN